MDFDEYEYLEKTVENPETEKEDLPSRNGTRSEEKERSRSSRHQHEDGERDSGHRSKRVRSEDQDRERRGSSRHGPSPDHRPRDGDRDRHRSGRDHRDERNGRDRERDRDKEREKDRERISERERDMEREKERSRRSRSRSEKHREEEREKQREKSREREIREKDLRESRRYKEKKEEGVEPEADPERDQRTVFAYQISLKADERDVYEFFSTVGKVRDVRLIMDRNSRRSKGVGYIEFYDSKSVPIAITLSNQPLLGQPVMVKPSEAEKNLVQSNTATVGQSGVNGPYSGGLRRLYVGNLHFNITEDQLRKVFEPFGTVELVQLPRDLETGLCKGYGFVQFLRLEDAKAALSLNGHLEIAGKIIKVSAVTDQVGLQDIGANTGDFDDDEGGGLSLNARSRALLMQKLDRSGTASSVVAGALVPPAMSASPLALSAASVLGVPPTVAAPLLHSSMPGLLGLPGSALPLFPAATSLVETPMVPSECLQLKNMFDPNVETEPDFDMDIKEDVQDECSKFGTVKHIFVDKNSAGHVYLRFDSANSAVNAQRALHGRWFAGKMITATFMTPQQYDAKFPNNS